MFSLPRLSFFFFISFTYCSADFMSFLWRAYIIFFDALIISLDFWIMDSLFASKASISFLILSNSFLSSILLWVILCFIKVFDLLASSKKSYRGCRRSHVNCYYDCQNARTKLGTNSVGSHCNFLLA